MPAKPCPEVPYPQIFWTHNVWQCTLLGSHRPGEGWPRESPALEMAGGRPQPANVSKGAARILAQDPLRDRLRPGKGKGTELLSQPRSPATTLSNHSPILVCACAAVLYQKDENYSHPAICTPRDRLVTVRSRHCKYFFLPVMLLHSNV